MRKILSLLILLGFLLLPITAMGQEEPPAPDVFRVLENILNYLFGGLLAFAVIMLVWAGYMFVSSTGDPEKVAKARYFVLYALIGVLVAFLSKGLVAAVQRLVEES